MATIQEKFQAFYESLDDDDRAALDALDPEASPEDVRPSLRRCLADLAGELSDDEKAEIAAALDGDVEGFDYVTDSRKGYWHLLVRDHRFGISGAPPGGVTVTPEGGVRNPHWG